MNKFLFPLLLIISLNVAFGQNLKNKKQIDSLNILIKVAKEDTTKVNLYNKIFIKYYPNDIEKMELYNAKIIQLSKKINYNQGIGFYYLNQTDIDYLNRDLEMQEKNALKAKKILSKEKNKHYYLRSILHLSYAYLDNRKLKEAANVVLENIDLAIKNKEYNIVAQMYTFLGESFAQDYRTKEALIYFKKALPYYEKSGKSLGKAGIYEQMSIIYNDIQLYDKALIYIDLCIELCKTKFEKHLVTYRKIDILNNQGKHKEALKLSIESDIFFSKQKHVSQPIISNNKLSLCNSYIGLGRYDDAIKNALLVIDKTEEAHDRVNLYIVLSTCYLNLKEIKNAKIYIDKAMPLFDSVKKGLKLSILENKSLVEEALGNLEIAYQYHKKYSSMKSEIFAEVNMKKIEVLEIEFELTEKENEIKKLEITSLQKTLNIEKQRKFLIISLFIICIAVLLIIIFIRVAESIKKRNKKIEIANIELSKASILIKKSLTEKELLLKEIHHRVKNNLQLVMSLLNIQAREGDTKDINDFLEKGQSRIISMALIHENLYQTDKLDKVNFQDYLTSLVDSINHAFDNKKTKINNIIKADKANFDIQTSIPLGLIINELYCNILKHAFPEKNEGHITIEFTNCENNSFQLTISDDGIGIKNKLNSKKTLGLELVQILVEQLNGTMITEIMNGTKFIINFKEVIS